MMVKIQSLRITAAASLTAACLLAATAQPCSAQQTASRFMLQSEPAQTVEAELTATIRAPDFQASEWIVYTAKLPSVPGQRAISSTLTPGGEVVREGSDLGRAVLQARVKPGKKDPKDELQVRARYQAHLYSRNLVAVLPGVRRPGVKPLDENVRVAALRSDSQIDFNEPGFQSWLDEQELRRIGDESAFDFGQRVFQYIQRSFKYDYQNQMNRKASAVCNAKTSDCGGMSFLFVAVMRANEIPARSLFGRWAKSAVPKQTVNGLPYYQYHVKAEFFDPEMGWVPVDLASGVLHDRTATGLRYFGRDTGDFIVFHVDTDLKLDTIHFGKKELLSLQELSFWVTGKGSLDGMNVEQDWTVREMP